MTDKNINDFIDEFCKIVEMKRSELFEKTNKHKITKYRHILLYLLAEIKPDGLELSPSRLERLINVDHSAFYYSRRKIDGSYFIYKKELSAIKAKFANGFGVFEYREEKKENEEFKEFLEISEAIEYIKNYNNWRRGAIVDQPNPRETGLALDFIINYYENKLKN